jgi:hypothetical protein
MINVQLIHDGKDFHGAGCDCGLCNSNGHAYGVKVMAAGEEVLEVIHGPSEQAAMHNARLACKTNDWKEVETHD